MGSAPNLDSVASSTPREGFVTTHWSAVLTAGETQTAESAEALESLCRAYWQPLYAYVRRCGYKPEEAQDLTQEFFAALFKRCVTRASRERGRFRTFLLTSLKHFLVGEWRKAEREKRGGGQVFVSWDAGVAEQCHAADLPGELTSEEVYERRWAITLMERVLARLRAAYQSTERGRLFDALKHCVWGNQPPKAYAGLAAELGSNEGAVKTSIHRLRRRCREVLRSEVAQTVARPEDIDEELRHLIDVFSG